MKYKKYGGKRFLWCGSKVGEFCEAYVSSKYNGACCPYHNNLLQSEMNKALEYPYK